MDSGLSLLEDAGQVGYTTIFAERKPSMIRHRRVVRVNWSCIGIVSCVMSRQALFLKRQTSVQRCGATSVACLQLPVQSQQTGEYWATDVRSVPSLGLRC